MGQIGIIIVYVIALGALMYFFAIKPQKKQQKQQQRRHIFAKSAIVFHRFSSDLSQFSKHFLLFYIIKLQATILFSDRSSIRRLFGFPNTAARHRRRRATCRQRNTSRPKQLFGQVLQPMDPLGAPAAAAGICGCCCINVS